MTLVRYQRGGGHEPGFDELLSVEEDGTFNLRRVVAADRIGEFAGTLDAKTLAAIRTLMAAWKGEAPASDSQLSTVVTERVTAAAGDVEYDTARKLPKDAAALVRRLRSLSETLKSHPSAAIELRLSSDASSATLSVLGGPVTVDFSHRDPTGPRPGLSYALFAEDEAYLGRGRIETELDGTAQRQLAAGWEMTVALPSSIEFNSQRTLKVDLKLRLLAADGLRRLAEVSAVAGKGWK